MKRTWLTYVAITASLIAGFVCSTAFGDNKGMKFSSGGMSGVARSFNGGSNSSGGSQNRTMQFQNQIKNHNLQSSGNSGNGLGITLGNGGLNGRVTPQIKTGNFGQVLGGTNGNSGVVGRTPQIKINPGTQIFNGNGNHNGNGGIGIGNSGIKIGTNNGIKIGGNSGIGVGIGGQHLQHAIGNGNKQCHIAPKCIDPCFSKGCSPHGNSCSPCLKNWNPICQPWWWTCHTHYCNQPIYYPVCTRPIVVTVPVFVGVPMPEQLVQVPVGSTLTLQALGLGDQPGRMILVMDKVSLESQVNEWKIDAVTATLPMFSLAAPTAAELVIVRADGQPATSMKIQLIPAQPAAVGAVQQGPAVQQAQFTQPAGELSAAAALVQ